MKAKDDADKSNMLSYIDNFKSILNDNDWKKFRSHMRSVTLHSMNADKLNTNDKRVFVKRTVIGIYNIFKNYPSNTHHLMNDFQTFFPDTAESMMFAKLITEHKEAIETKHVQIPNKQVVHTTRKHK